MNVRFATNTTAWSFVRTASLDEIGPWLEFLDDAAEAGYDGVEHFQAFAPAIDPDLLHRELDQRSLELAGLALYGELESPDGRESIEKQLRAVAPFVTELGAQYLYVHDAMYTDVMTGEQIGSSQLEPNEWAYLIDTTYYLNGLTGEFCGVPLLVHPHEFSHIDTPDQVERFLIDTEPVRISLILDAGQYVHRGGDPARLYAEHHERIEQLHVKNFNRALLPENRTSLGALTASGTFADLTLGEVDFAALRDALIAHSFNGWITIELLRIPTMIESPATAVTRALNHLYEIEYGQA